MSRMKGTDVSSRTSTVATRVFVPAAAVILAVVAITLLFPQQFSDFITEGNQVLVGRDGRYFRRRDHGVVHAGLRHAVSQLGHRAQGTDGEAGPGVLGGCGAMRRAAALRIS